MRPRGLAAVIYLVILGRVFHRSVLVHETVTAFWLKLDDDDEKSNMPAEESFIAQQPSGHPRDTHYHCTLWGQFLREEERTTDPAEERTMSSTEIVHGNNNSITPQPVFSGGSTNHAESYAAQAQEQPAPAAVSAAAADPSATGIDDQRFTTSYGMVVWPTLPGLSSSSSPSSSVPVPAPGTKMSSAPADLVHHHSPSEATAAPRTAQTLLPSTMATMSNSHTNGVGGGGGPLVRCGVCSLMPVVGAQKWLLCCCVQVCFPFHTVQISVMLRNSRVFLGCFASGYRL